MLTPFDVVERSFQIFGYIVIFCDLWFLWFASACAHMRG